MCTHLASTDHSLPGRGEVHTFTYMLKLYFLFSVVFLHDKILYKLT